MQCWFYGAAFSRCLPDCERSFCVSLFTGVEELLFCSLVCWVPSCIRAVGTLPRATGSFATAEGKLIICANSKVESTMGWRFLKATNKQTAKLIAKIGNIKSIVERVAVIFSGLNQPKISVIKKRNIRGIVHQRLQRTLFLKGYFEGVFSLGVMGCFLVVLKVLNLFIVEGRMLFTALTFLKEVPYMWIWQVKRLL